MLQTRSISCRRNRKQQRKPSSAPPDSLPPKSDSLPGDLRREDPAATAIAPDTCPMPAKMSLRTTSRSARMRWRPMAATKPIRSTTTIPPRTYTPRDYEEQIDEVANARRDRNKRAKAEER